MTTSGTTNKMPCLGREVVSQRIASQQIETEIEMDSSFSMLRLGLGPSVIERPRNTGFRTMVNSLQTTADPRGSVTR